MKASLRRLAVGLVAGVALVGRAETCYWTGAGGDNKWSNVGNWAVGSPNGAAPASAPTVATDVVLDGAGNALIDVDGEGYGARTLSTTNTADLTKPVTVAGLPLTVQGAFYTRVDTVISNAVSLSADSRVDFYNYGKTLTFVKPVSAPSATEVVFGRTAQKSSYDFKDAFTAPLAAVKNHGAFHTYVYFRGKVTAKSVTSGSSSDNSDVQFFVSGNEVGQLSVPHYSSFYIDAPNAFSTNTVFVFPSSPSNVNGDIFYVTGDQAVDRIQSPNGAQIDGANRVKGNAAYDSTITMKATEDAFAMVAFQGKLSLVWDPVANGTLTVTNQTSNMDGSLNVLGGTVEIVGDANFSQAKALLVGDGATLRIDSTFGGTVFPKAKKVRLENGATLVVSANTPSAFGNDVRLVTTNTANVVLNADVTVQTCHVDGVPLAVGTYAAAQLAGFSGSGRLTVKKRGAEPTFIDYIQTHGAQYVDLGVVGKTPCSMVGTFAFDEYRTGDNNCNWLFGSSYSGHEIDVGVQVKNASEIRGWTLGYAGTYWPWATKPELDTWFTVEADFAKGLQTLKVDGVTKLTQKQNTDISAGYSMALMAMNNTGTIKSYSAARCSSFRLEAPFGLAMEKRLQRDLRPAKAEGVYGMWDSVQCELLMLNNSAMPCDTITWTGGGDGVRWSDPENWDLGRIPNGDIVSVVLDEDLTMVNDIDDLAIKKFYATGSGKNLTLTGKEISIWDAGVSWSNACRKVTVGTPITFLNAVRSDLVCNAEGIFNGDVVCLGGELDLFDVANKPMTFNGEVRVPDGDLYTPVGMNGMTITLTFNGRVICRAFYAPGRNSKSDTYAQGMRYFNAMSNDIEIVYGHHSDLYFRAGGNTFTEKTRLAYDGTAIYTGWGSPTGHSGVHIRDNTTEVINRLTGKVFDVNKCRITAVTAGATATLHLKGTASDTTSYRLWDAVNLIWDPTGDYVQCFTNGNHQTTGFIEVRRGAVESGGTNTFRKVRKIIVRSGARFFANAKSDVVGSLEGLEELRVEDGGTFRASAHEINVFGETAKAVFRLETGAAFDFGGATPVIAVDSVLVDGTPLATGDHTSVAGIDLGGATLRVANSNLSVWKAAVDGNWSEGAKWTGEEVPSAKEALVTATGSDYVVTADADVAASSVEVGGDGTLAFSGGVRTISSDVVMVRDGGMFKVEGDATKLLLTTPSKDAEGWAFRIDEGGTYVQSGGRVEVAGTGTGLVGVNGGTFAMTGGELVLPTGRKSAAKQFALNGGAFDMSGDAKLIVSNTWSAYGWPMFGNGSVSLAGSAGIFGQSPGNNTGLMFSGDAGGELRMSVTDSACVYAVEVVSFGGVAGSRTIVDWASSHTAAIAHGSYVAQGAGFAELTVAAGARFLPCSMYNFCVGYGVGGAEVDGVVNVNGLLSYNCSAITWSGRSTSWDSCMIGAASTEAATAAQPDGEGGWRRAYRGTVNVNAGGVLKSSNTTSGRLIVGVGRGAYGVLNVKGGAVTNTVSDAKAPTILGYAGGEGESHVTDGGHMVLSGSLYVGGCPTNVTKITVMGAMADENDAKGLLDLVDGGVSVVGNLVVGEKGAGTVRLRPGAQLDVAGEFRAEAGAKLVVDVSDWDGKRSFTLARFGSTAAGKAFAAVETVGTLPLNAKVKITDTRIRLSAGNGTVIYVR